MADFQTREVDAQRRLRLPALPPESDPLPKVVYIELADYCNLNCVFCGRANEIETIRAGDKGGFIPVETLQKLEKPLRAAQYLGLSGRIGEPLLHPKLEYILRWVYQINPSILLRITTNGTALSRKMAELLGEHLDSLSISLNASNAEAYFREMRPVGQRSAHPAAWWDNLIRRITEFIGALPISDRDRIRIIAPVQRDNIDDVFDFIRLVAGMGCSHAVITPMLFHDDSKIDMSIYWIKDKYNDVIDDTAALATGLGVHLEAARFYTNPKLENVDLDSLCRDPIETAYLNMEEFGGATPCCHWIEELFTTDVYSDENAFERFWNSDAYRRLRRKRDFKSCQECGLARSFDEVGFHFTPLLKKNLVESQRRAEVEARGSPINWHKQNLGRSSQRCAEAEAEGGYPDSELVRVCRSLSLDLRSLRRTVLALGVPLKQLDPIKRYGLLAIPEIDRACWDAFLRIDAPACELTLGLGGCFAGIGWFEPDNDVAARVSARWMGGGKHASAFARVVPGHAYQLRVTAHHLRVPDMASWLHLTACHELVAVERLLLSDDTAVLTAEITKELATRHGGRLRIGVIYNDLYGIDGWVSVSRLEAVRLDEPNQEERNAMTKFERFRRGIRRYLSTDSRL